MTTGSPGQHGVADPAGQRAPGVGRVAAPRCQGGRVHRPGGRRVDDAQVGGRPGPDRAPLVAAVAGIEPGDGRRLPAEQGAATRARGRSSSVTARARRGLQAEHARGGLVEGRSFSSGAWGAWSVAMASAVPSARAGLDRVDVAPGAAAAGSP